MQFTIQTRLAAAGLAAAASASTLGLWYHGSNPAQAQNAPANFVQATDSTVQLIDHTTLAADRPGIVKFVEPEEGQYVRTDQLVAGLRDEITRATLIKEQEKASNVVHIEFAQKSSAVAEKELEASEEANRRVPDTVPQVEIEKLRLAWQKGLLQIEQAEFEKRIAELTVQEQIETLKTHEVRATFDGKVIKVHKRPGEPVRQGDPILEIIGTSRVRIEGFVSIPDSYRIREGDRVVVKLSQNEFELPQYVLDEQFEGTVKLIDPRVSQIIGKVKIWAEVENKNDILRSGLSAQMRIVPRAAVQAAAVGR